LVGLLSEGTRRPPGPNSYVLRARARGVYVAAAGASAPPPPPRRRSQRGLASGGGHTTAAAASHAATALGVPPSGGDERRHVTTHGVARRRQRGRCVALRRVGRGRRHEKDGAASLAARRKALEAAPSGGCSIPLDALAGSRLSRRPRAASDAPAASEVGPCLSSWTLGPWEVLGVDRPPRHAVDGWAVSAAH